MRTSLKIFIVLWFVLIGSTAPALGQPEKSDARITNVTYSGEGEVTIDDAGLVLWKSGPHEFVVKIFTTAAVSAQTCLATHHSASRTDREVVCVSTNAGANRFVTVRLQLDTWPATLTGVQNLSLVLKAGPESIVIAEKDLRAIVIRPTGDLDGDGLANKREASLGTDLRSGDTDDDGLSDKVEIQTFGTTPTNDDSDEDGLTDFAEVHSHGTDPTETDTDDDGLDDRRELALNSSPISMDSDGDGQDDGSEVLIYGTDPTDPDTDNDGLNDRVEISELQTNPRRPDTDGDGLTDNLEVNTYEIDPTRVDSDADGIQDGKEVEVYQTNPAVADSDSDGIPDGQEINTYGTDPTAPDSDGDGLSDGKELNLYGTNPNRIDTDDDGTSDTLEVETQQFDPNEQQSLLVGGILVFGVLIGGVLYRSGRLSFDHPTPTASSSGSEVTPPPENPEDSAPDPEELATIPDEYLPNDDRVMSLLTEHGGKLQQSEIVEKTGWSKSKVSRVLTQMEENDKIVKIDVGRGNLITYPENVPQGAAAPFDD